MLSTAIIGIFILAVILLFSSILSTVWVLILQIGALVGLVFIGTLIVKGRRSYGSDSTDYDHRAEFHARRQNHD